MATVEELIRQSENELKGKSTSELIALANGELGGKQPMAWADVGSQAVGSLPSSALKLGEAITAPIHSPVQTIKGIGSLVKEALIPWGEQTNTEAVAKSMSDKYGSMENFKNAIASDPLGVASDMSMVLTGAGGMANLAKLPKVAANLRRASAIADPLNIITEPAKLAAKSIPKSIQNTLYKSALKPSATLKQEEVLKRVRTGIEEGIPVSAGGLEKSKSIVKNINKDIMERIDQFDNLGQTVDLNAPISKIDALSDVVKSKNIAPQDRLSQIEKVKSDVLSAQPASQVGIKQAQVYKQSLNAELDDFYKRISQGDNINKLDTMKAKAALADGLREEITAIYPELKNLNAREGSLIQLNKSLQRRVNNISNREIIPLITAVMGSSSKLPALKALSVYLIDRPYLKSSLAIALNSAKKKEIFKSPHMGLQSSRMIGDLTGGQNNDVQ